MLIDQGSWPLKERDGQRKTNLHYVAQVKHLEAALATCKALLEHERLTSSKHSLLLWASTTGIGTADEMEDVHPHVKAYLGSRKEKDIEPLLRRAEQDRITLLRAVVVNNDPGMAWELLSRGANMVDIHDPDWTNRLQPSEREPVNNVLSHMDNIKEQGRDQPSMEDKLGTNCLT